MLSHCHRDAEDHRRFVGRVEEGRHDARDEEGDDPRQENYHSHNFNGKNGIFAKGKT